MSTYCPTYAPGPTFRRQPAPAESDAARLIAGTVRTALSHLAFLPPRGLADELRELVESASGGAGEGESAVDGAASDAALAFLGLLPRSLPTPELSLDTDGEIEMDWYGPAGKAFTLSIRGDGRIAYAARFGRDKRLHGVDSISDEAASALATLIYKAVR
jgi:hypothetical protein